MGSNYTTESRPTYDRDALLRLCSPENLQKDTTNMLEILEKWKKRQDTEKPVLVIINTSGGGNRSATFTMNILQRLDSLTGGTIMRKVFMITGASGGMIGASYFRELTRLRNNPGSGSSAGFKI